MFRIIIERLRYSLMRAYLKVWLRLIRRYSFIIDMSMVDGTSAKGKVFYAIGFNLPDGGELMLTPRIYEGESTMAETHKMLALSTSHLTEHTCNTQLHELLLTFPFYEKLAYGWFLGVVEENLDELPTELEQIMLWAHDHGYSWIMFDRDVEAIDEFPTFDW